jgi:RNA polymerase sigma-70 factor (ECF subfamily)
MESIGCIHDCCLVREVQGGNQAAFQQLVHAYDQAVLRLALRITGSQSDAQDIYQEAFLKAYNKLGDFRFECSFSTWIYRIVTHVCLDYLRKNRNRRENSAIEGTAEGARILCALQSLKPRERMVFDLKHFQGMKLRTVSEILNTSEGSIKASLFRATEKLRFELAGVHKREEIFDEATL